MTKLVAKVTSRTPVSVEEDDEGDPAGDSRQSLSVAFCLSAVCRQSQLPTVRTGRRGVPARGGQNAADVKGPEGAVMGPPLLTGRATSYSPLPLPHSLLATLAWFSSGMHPLFSASGPQNTPFFLPGLVLLSLCLADTFLTFRVSGERSKAAHVPQSRSLDSALHQLPLFLFLKAHLPVLTFLSICHHIFICVTGHFISSTV